MVYVVNRFSSLSGILEYEGCEGVYANELDANAASQELQDREKQHYYYYDIDLAPFHQDHYPGGRPTWVYSSK